MTLSRSAVTMFAALSFVVAGAGVANATASQEDYVAQAKAAGLTTDQATALQAKVDRYLTATGGKQIAPNRIDLNGDGLVSVAVPGEAHPRSLTSGASTNAVEESPCDYGEQRAQDGHFCAYEFNDFQGDTVDAFHCVKYSLPGWTGIGSWINQQTPGVRAKFYGKSGNLLLTTPVPNSWDRNYDWTPVWTIKPC